MVDLKVNWRPGEKYTADEANKVGSTINAIQRAVTELGTVRGKYDLTPTDFITTDYTAAVGELVRATNTAGIKITLPDNAQDNDTVAVLLLGAGEVTLAAGGTAGIGGITGDAEVPLSAAQKLVLLSVWLYDATEDHWFPISETSAPASTDIVDSSPLGRALITGENPAELLMLLGGVSEEAVASLLQSTWETPTFGNSDSRTGQSFSAATSGSTTPWNFETEPGETLVGVVFGRRAAGAEMGLELNYGTDELIKVGPVVMGEGVAANAANAAFGQFFILPDSPGGNLAVQAQWTADASAAPIIAVAVASWSGVASFSPQIVETGKSGSSLEQTVSSAAGRVVVQFVGTEPLASNPVTGYGPIPLETLNAGQYAQGMFGWAEGAPSVTFVGSRGSGSQYMEVAFQLVGDVAYNNAALLLEDTTSFGRDLVDQPDAAAARAHLGVSTPGDSLAEISEAEIDAGTASTTRAISARRAAYIRARSGSSGSGGGWGNLDSPIDTDAVSAITAAQLSYGAGASTTSIADGIIAADLASPAGKLRVLGAAAADLDTIATSRRYANWKTHTDGTTGSHTAPTVSFGVEFWVSGSRYVEFDCYATDDPFLHFSVDGKIVSDVPVDPTWTNNSANTVKLDLGDTKAHLVRLMLYKAALGKVWTGPVGTVWTSTFNGPRTFILGDSLSSSSAGTNTGRELGTWWSRFNRLCGFGDYWNGGIAGTGPNQGASGYTNSNYKTRVSTEAVPAAAGIYFVGIYNNDWANGRTASQIAADLLTVCTTLAAMPSAPDIIVIGGMDATGVNGSTWTTMDDAVEAAITGVSGVAHFISPVTGKVVAKDGTVMKAAGSTGWTTAGSVGTMLGADNIHPNDYGHSQIAYRMRDAIDALAPRLTRVASGVASSVSAASVGAAIGAAAKATPTVNDKVAVLDAAASDALKNTPASALARLVADAAAGGTTHFRDTFTRANGSAVGSTVESGGLTWSTLVGGTWTVNSNRLGCTATSATCALTVNPIHRFGTLRATLAEKGANSQMGLIFAVTDIDNRLTLTRDGATNKYWRLTQRVGGTDTTLFTSTNVIANNDVLEVFFPTMFTVTVKLNGTTMVADQAFSTSLTGTRYGFSATTTTTDAFWDDIELVENSLLASNKRKAIVTAVTSSATPAIRMDLGDWSTISVGHNITAITTSGTPSDLQFVGLKLVGTGSFTLAFGSAWNFGFGVSAPSSIANGKAIYIEGRWNATTSKIDVRDVKIEA